MPIARAALFAATALVIVAVGYAALASPLPLWVAAAICVAYAVLFTAGVTILRLRMFVDAIVSGPPNARGVLLTFDDGPHPEHTVKVLDLLDAHEARAVFFVIGEKAARHPDTIAEIVRRGHSIGIHGYRHSRVFALQSPTTLRSDLRAALRAVEEITGERPSMFRPPIGHTSPAVARVADELELDVIGWSARGRDGLAGAEPEEVARRIEPGLCDGAIVLMHDARERDDGVPAAIEALPLVFDAMTRKQLSCAAPEDWLLPALAGSEHGA